MYTKQYTHVSLKVTISKKEKRKPFKEHNLPRTSNPMNNIYSNTLL